MDFIFQDDGAEIIRRELLSPRPAIFQSLSIQDLEQIQSNPNQYLKLAASCRATIADEHTIGNRETVCTQTQQNDHVFWNEWENPANDPFGGLQIEDAFAQISLGEETQPETPEQKKCREEQTRESKKDAEAKKIEALIRAKKDWRSREYGAVIIRRANETLRISEELSEGDAFNVDIEYNLQDGETIVGFVHNHTEFSAANPANPSAQDWQSAWWRVYQKEANRLNFSIYILSVIEDALAEFDFVDDYRSNEATASNFADAEGECDA